MSKSGFPETAGEFHALLREGTDILARSPEVLVVYDSGGHITNKRVLSFFDALLDAELDNPRLIFISDSRALFSHMVGEGRHMQIGSAELAFSHECEMFHPMFRRNP